MLFLLQRLWEAKYKNSIYVSRLLFWGQDHQTISHSVTILYKTSHLFVHLDILFLMFLAGRQVVRSINVSDVIDCTVLACANTVGESMQEHRTS